MNDLKLTAEQKDELIKKVATQLGLHHLIPYEDELITMIPTRINFYLKLSIKMTRLENTIENMQNMIKHMQKIVEE